MEGGHLTAYPIDPFPFLFLLHIHILWFISMANSASAKRNETTMRIQLVEII
jgi:hypothetical protein